MKISKKSFPMVFILIVVLSAIVAFPTLIVSADIRYQLTEQHLAWVVLEEIEGRVFPIAVGADCVTNFSIDAYQNSSYTSIIKHSIFACAKNWSGDNYGYNLYPYVSPAEYYDANNNLMRSISLDNYDSNVLVNPDWIWTKWYSNSIYNVGGAGINGRGSGYFYCVDAYTANMQSVTSRIQLY